MPLEKTSSRSGEDLLATYVGPQKTAAGPSAPAGGYVRRYRPAHPTGKPKPLFPRPWGEDATSRRATRHCRRVATSALRPDDESRRFAVSWIYVGWLGTHGDRLAKAFVRGSLSPNDPNQDKSASGSKQVGQGLPRVRRMSALGLCLGGQPLEGARCMKEPTDEGRIRAQSTQVRTGSRD
jgi:hypothetical protein